eukprot:538232-Hanusia_phi.AAC.1
MGRGLQGSLQGVAVRVAFSQARRGSMPCRKGDSEQLDSMQNDDIVEELLMDEEWDLPLHNEMLFDSLFNAQSPVRSKRKFACGEESDLDAPVALSEGIHVNQEAEGINVNCVAMGDARASIRGPLVNLDRVLLHSCGSVVEVARESDLVLASDSMQRVNRNVADFCNYWPMYRLDQLSRVEEDQMMCLVGTLITGVNPRVRSPRRAAALSPPASAPGQC